MARIRGEPGKAKAGDYALVAVALPGDFPDEQAAVEEARRVLLHVAELVEAQGGGGG